MKITFYEGEKIRLHKGEVLAIVNEYGRGKWAKVRKTLCIIKEHFFKNGNAKRQDFEIVKTIKVLEKGYTWDIWASQNYDVIDRGE